MKKGRRSTNQESIADQSLRLRMEVVKELDSGVDIDLKGIGFVETKKQVQDLKQQSHFL